MNQHSLSKTQAPGLRPATKGFSLIEMIIAISVVSLTFIGLIGLLGLGVVNDQASSQQTLATTIAASILADLRSTPTYSTKSSRYGLTLPTSIPVPGTATAPFSGVGPTYYLYFDSSPSLLPLATPKAYTTAQSPVPSGSVYVADVYLARIGTAGLTSMTALLQSNDMVRVVVSWPARTTTIPVGSVDVISQFLIH